VTRDTLILDTDADADAYTAVKRKTPTDGRCNSDGYAPTLHLQREIFGRAAGEKLWAFFNSLTAGNGLKNKTITPYSPSLSLLTTTTSKREESTLFEPT